MLPILTFLMGCNIDYEISTNETIVWSEPSVIIEDEIIISTDEFRLPARQAIDILFMVDHSGSMDDNKAQINRNIKQFFSTLKAFNIDYHVGITSTSNQIVDEAGIVYPYADIPYINDQVINPEIYFSMMMISSMLGGIAETAIDALYASLSINFDKNKEFYRNNTPLHVIVISDENDQSTYKTANQLISLLKTYERDNQTNVDVSSIITLASEVNCSDTYGINGTPGYRYMYLTKVMDGQIINICDENWSNILTDLALYSIDLKYEYVLNNKPIVDTIIVNVMQGNITFTFEEADWTYKENSNSIIFNTYKPIAGDIITVKYEHFN